MLVLRKLKGKMTKRKVVFQERQWLMYKGKLAHAGGGGSAPKNEVVPTGPWGPQIPAIQTLLSEAGRMYTQGPPQYYPGQTVLPETGLVGATRDAAVSQVNQNTGQNNAVANTAANAATNAYSNPVAQTAYNMSPNFQQSLMSLMSGKPSGELNYAGQILLPSVTGAVQNATNQQASQQSAPMMNPGNMDINSQLTQSLNGTAMSPYLDQVIQGALRSSTNNFQRNVMPAIGDAASSAGQVGGSRHGVAQGIAAGDLAAQQNDMVGRIYQQQYDQAAQDRTNAMSLIAQAQGQNQSAQLQTNALNEQIRAALMGESLTGAQIGGNLLTQGTALNQQGQLGAAGLAGNLLTQGQQLGTDQLVRTGAMLPGLQGANLTGLDFANQLGVQQYGFQQAQQDADVERWFFEQFAPYNALTQFQNYVTGPYGSSIAGKPNQQVDPNTGQLIPGLADYVERAMRGGMYTRG